MTSMNSTPEIVGVRSMVPLSVVDGAQPSHALDLCQASQGGNVGRRKRRDSNTQAPCSAYHLSKMAPHPAGSFPQ
jgi:hypothetical protein